MFNATLSRVNLSSVIYFLGKRMNTTNKIIKNSKPNAGHLRNSYWSVSDVRNDAKYGRWYGWHTTS